MSKNTSGLKLELFYSKTFHDKGIPLLVSPLLLRRRDLGQLDIARLIQERSGWVLEIGEVKSSEMGMEQMEKFQKKRLNDAQKFLAALFGHRTRLIRLVGNKISTTFCI